MSDQEIIDRLEEFIKFWTRDAEHVSNPAASAYDVCIEDVKGLIMWIKEENDWT